MERGQKVLNTGQQTSDDYPFCSVLIPLGQGLLYVQQLAQSGCTAKIYSVKECTAKRRVQNSKLSLLIGEVSGET